MLKCSRCKFWDGPSGECRRHAPAAHLTAGTRQIENYRAEIVEHDGYWPKTVHSDWCGEARPRVVRTRPGHMADDIIRGALEVDPPTTLDAEAES